MLPSTQKQQKRQVKEKLQKKLELRQLTLYDALQQDLAVDWFKQNNPAFLALLSSEGMKQMINYIVVPGPQQQKMRSYKIPMIATQILSTPCPKVFQLMFTQDKKARGGCTVGWLIEYFWKGQPNYVISGYVIKILNNLIPGNPHKVLEYMIKNACPQMLMFLQSHSVAQFLLRMIIVQDLLLNAFIKQRLQIFNQIVQIYIQNKQPKQVLQNVNYMLCESFNRLWSQKNKQLGRFSSSLLRMVEVVIDYDDKFKEEKFLPIVVKLLADHGNIAPVIIMVIYRKIYKKLSSLKPKVMRTQQSSQIQTFSSINLYLLQAVSSIVTYFPGEFSKFLEKQNIFVLLLGFVNRFQWNNIVLVEIQKIIKQSMAKKDNKIYKALLDRLLDSMKQWKETANTAATSGKRFGRGYKGMLNSLQSFLRQSLKHNQAMKQYLEKNPTTKDKIQRLIPASTALSTKQSQQVYGFRVVHNIALPSYKSIHDLILQHSDFFAQTDTINKKYLLQNPADHIKHKEDEALMNEIQNQNQLVYKLLTQTMVATGTSNGSNSNGQDGQKKGDDSNNGE